MLKGYDVSKWQSVTPSNCDFLIARASYGNVPDRMFVKHMLNAKTDLVGAYHYALTKKDPIDQAKVFLKAIENDDHYGKTMILALDIEGADATRSNTIDWCIKWLEYVENKTGIKPIIYTSSSLTKRFKALSDLNYGLWVAHWVKKNKPTIYNWRVWALWQYSDGNGKLDHNYFNGNRDQYLRYCKPNLTIN